MYIDYPVLEAAFQDSSYEISHWLNRETEEDKCSGARHFFKCLAPCTPEPKRNNRCPMPLPYPW